MLACYWSKRSAVGGGRRRLAGSTRAHVRAGTWNPDSGVPQVGLPAGLHESQGHPIRLADRQILVAIFVTERERRRQGPHAFRIVLGVLRVVVDRRFRIEAEA